MVAFNDADDSRNGVRCGKQWTDARARRWPVRVTEDERNFYVDADLPIARPDDLRILALRRVVVIRLRIARPGPSSGRASRARAEDVAVFITFPAAIDEHLAHADFRDRHLRITLPKWKGTRPYTVPINALF